MKRLATALATAVIGVSLVGAPQQSSAMDGELFGGADIGVTVPTNALDRAADEGGSFSPFVGYMFFPPEDRRINVGAIGQIGFFGLSRDLTTTTDGGRCPNGCRNKNTWALPFGAGPRVSLPIDEFELNGKVLIGGITGLNSGPISDTSWGWTTGGGIDYWVDDNWKVGAFGEFSRFYQRVRGIGDVRYVNAGIRVTATSGKPVPEAPPPPPPPPPPPAETVIPTPTKRITLRGVNFDFDKATIRGDARVILDEAIRILQDEGEVAIVAEGHTDATGPEAYNQTLSVRRANAVRDYLVEGGVPASRISVEGFGETKPVATNSTKDGRAQNRRVELRVAD